MAPFLAEDLTNPSSNVAIHYRFPPHKPVRGQTLPDLPNKTCCARCEAPGNNLRRCAKCLATPYCSVECQRVDWKFHKTVCMLYRFTKGLNNSGIYLGEKGKKVRTGSSKRTKKDVFRDLGDFANAHNLDTITFTAWTLLDLVTDITNAQTHVVTLTLQRTKSKNPLTYYTFVEAEVLPFSVIEEIYCNGAREVRENRVVTPRGMLEEDFAERKPHGALGSAMIVLIELPEGVVKPPHNTLKKISNYIIQTVGLFETERDTFSELGSHPPLVWLKCLQNAFKGGAYSTTFEPRRWTPDL